MATALDVITRALRKIRVLSSGEVPTDEEATDGLAELNDMLFGWRNEGVDLAHVALALTDTLDVPEDHLETIRLSLAERLLSDFGGSLSPLDTQRAENGRNALRAIYFTIQPLSVDHPFARDTLASRP